MCVGVSTDIEALSRQSSDVIPFHPAEQERQMRIPLRYRLGTDKPGRNKKRGRHVIAPQNRRSDFVIVEIAVVESDRHRTAHISTGFASFDLIGKRDNAEIFLKESAECLE